MEKKPSLALIPSAYKAGKLYSVLPADGVGDFDFSRATTATRINKDGLIETVGSNIPRLNYPLIDGVVSGCPSLLLENSSTNVIPYSEDFSNAWWTKSGSSVVSGFVSPKGDLSAFNLIENTATQAHYAVTQTVTESEYSFSVFAKKSSRFIQLAGNLTVNDFVNFDLSNGTIGTIGSGATNAKIKEYPNGWFRCSITTTLSTSVIALVPSSTTSYVASYQGDGTSGIYIWGAMLEQNDYSTSYIPTNGSQVTRSAETCNNAGDVNTFNDSEGVLFAEISALANDQTNRLISLTNGTSSERISLFYSQDFSNEIKGIVFDGGVATAELSFISNDITDTSKIALKYKQNNFALWVNGIEVVSEDNGTVPSGLNKLAFDLGVSSTVLPFYGNIKDLRVYNTALTDLEELTSWKSFNEMARDLLYTIQ